MNPRRKSKACGMYPTGYGGPHRRSWLYAIGYANGMVKIGKTAAPLSRVGGHVREGEGSVTWTHLFASCREDRDAVRIERLACSMAAEIGQRVRMTERFRGLSRAQVIACVRAAFEAAEVGQAPARVPELVA
jgi:hypothetical protein